MGANDVQALDANFKSWHEKRFPNPKKDTNLFEYYCVDQFLRPFDLSDSQLKTGLIGGGLDGGVDAIFMFVNGELIDAESELDPKTPNDVKLLLMQTKEGEGFSPPAIDKFYWFVDDLLDLTRKKADYHSTYSSDLVALMRLFKDKFGVIVGENPPLSIDILYITKRDVSANADCEKSVTNIDKMVHSHFNQAVFDFRFINATGLWAQVQKRPQKKKSMTWAFQPMSTQEGEIGLVKLPDYYEFLKEPNGDIAERIFDSNVRGYWKSTPVNKRIASTLKDLGSSEFWLLNNGITILAEQIDNGGFLKIEITDPQIVNGLQTSRQIFNYYREGLNIPIPDNRRVLVRVIKTADTTVRDDVVRCTNSQNVMPEEALRATDAIHRQIETLFHRYDLYYDRRKGHYRDRGKPVDQIVSVVDVLQAMQSIVIRRPDDARARPRNYFSDNELYSSVFGQDKFDLNLYLKVTQIMRRIESFLDDQGLSAVDHRNLKFYLGYYAASTSVQSAYPAIGKTLKLELDAFSDELLSGCLSKVRTLYEKLAIKLSVEGETDYDALAKGPHLLKRLNGDLKRRFRSAK
jgi:hypothetical protein